MTLRFTATARIFSRDLSLALVGLMLLATFAPAAEPDAPAPAELELKKKIRIVNQNQEPVAGATVIPWAVRSKQGHGAWRVKGDWNQEPPKIVTDAEGRGEFAFPRFIDKDGKVPPMAFTCSVSHPDYAGSSYNDVPVSDGALDDEWTIGVRPEALIEITPFTVGQTIDAEHLFVHWSGPAPDRTRIKADERGTIRLPRLPAGTELLQVVYAPNDGATMFSDVQKLELEEGDHHQLRTELKPAVRVEGRLEGPVTRPVKDGRVIAEIIHSTAEFGDSLTWRAAAKMRIDGSFVFESMPPGNLQVIALCPGAMADNGEPPAFATAREKEDGAAHFSRPQVFKLTDETTHIVLKMVATADCLVRVVGPDGAPIEGAQCAFSPNVGWWNDGSQIYCNPFYSTIDYLKDRDAINKARDDRKLFGAVTDAQGEALIRDLPAKPQRLGVYHETLETLGGNDVNARQAVQLTAGEQTEVTVKLVPKTPAKK